MIITLNDKRISRASMPQISRENRADFVRYLASLGVKVTSEIVPAAGLQPTQSEVNSELLDKMRADFEPSLHPLFVAADGFVLDGHNRLYIGTEREINLDVTKADCSIIRLLKLAREFPDVKYRTIADLSCRKGLR